jgi:hypothetical protein
MSRSHSSSSCRSKICRATPPGLRGRSLATSRILVLASLLLAQAGSVLGDQLWAGAAKVDITNRDAGPVHDPLFAKALVLKNDQQTVAIVTIDAVAIGEIGSIRNDFLPNLRSRIEKELPLPPENLVVNASHCHGVVCSDVELRTFQAIQQALQNLEPVRVASGTGQEDRIMENRRLKLRDGSEADVRHAYSLPPDEEVVAVGPIDPEIGVLRLDRMDGRVLAIVYNFACHPIQGVPGGANSADLTGIASQVLEDNLDPGTVALFLQGCGGDINPIFYKDVDHPRSAEPLWHRLGLSTLKAVRPLEPKEDSRLAAIRRVLSLPRRDVAERIASLEAEQESLLRSLKGTSLNLKTFLPLVTKYQLSTEFPSYYSHRYLHDQAIGRADLQHLDAENRRNLAAYIDNIHAMEKLSRNQTNLALLRKHQMRLVDEGKRTVEAEVLGIRIGDFVLVTFPGELTVQIGLNLKERSPHPHTFVAGYSNGYLYYAPTAEQLRNLGRAQEDSDCILAPEWQAQFEAQALELLRQL